MLIQFMIGYSLTISATTLVSAVIGIFLMRTEKKMVWPYTRTRVAFVKYKRTRGNRSFMQLV